jgi:membrane protein required for colicin V production
MLDFIILIALGWAVYKGFTKGLIVAVFSLLAFIVGLAAATKLSAVVAGWLGKQVTVDKHWIPMLSFTLVFIATVFLVHFGAKMIEKTVKMAMLGWVNRAGGILFYVVLYMVILSVILFYANKLQIISPSTFAASKMYTLIKDVGPSAINGLGVVIPIFKDVFKQLEDFFGGVAVKVASK